MLISSPGVPARGLGSRPGSRVCSRFLQHRPAEPMPPSRVPRPILLSLRFLALGLFVAVYALTWHPADRETAPVACSAPAPALQPGQALKVMTWNIQYLAGKRYVF